MIGNTVGTTVYKVAKDGLSDREQKTIKSYLDDIEDFVEGEKPEKNKIKVKGRWYDYYGDKIDSQSR